jgi:hypothetical protein
MGIDDIAGLAEVCDVEQLQEVVEYRLGCNPNMKYFYKGTSKCAPWSTVRERKCMGGSYRGCGALVCAVMQAHACMHAKAERALPGAAAADARVSNRTDQLHVTAQGLHGQPAPVQLHVLQRAARQPAPLPHGARDPVLHARAAHGLLRRPARRAQRP